MDISVMWFRRDLRLHDNQALSEATSNSQQCLYVFCLDPWFFEQPEIGWLRVRFMFESLAVLDEALQKAGNQLLILKGESVATLTNLLTTLQREGYHPKLYFNYDIQVEYGRQRDQAITEFCHQNDIPLHNGHSYFLLHNENQMTDWWRRYYAYQYDRQYDAPSITAIDSKLKAIIQKLPQIDPQRIAIELDINLPTPRQALFMGGEAAARQAIYSFLKDRVDGYRWKISRPYLAQRGATSLLGPHLAFGTISNRTVFQTAVNYRLKLKATRPKKAFDIATYLDRLRWRDSFTQRLWFHPELIWKNHYHEFNALYNDEPLNNQQAEYLKRWQDGETGFPLLDAAMRQLKQDGFINFRMRAMAATFLTINCQVSWHHGARHFMNQLVDGDIAINHWQWQMQAGITNPLSQTFRMYSPTKNFRDRDPNADYVHFWLPETTGQNVTKILQQAKPMLDFAQTRKDNGKIVADTRKQVRNRLIDQTSATSADAQDISNRIIKYDKHMAYRYERKPVVRK